MSALEPLPDKSVTATETGLRYPEPNVKSARYSNAVPEPTYAWVTVLVPTLVVNVVADNMPVTLNDLSFGMVNVGLNVKPSNLTNSLIFLNQ